MDSDSPRRGILRGSPETEAYRRRRHTLRMRRLVARGCSRLPTTTSSSWPTGPNHPPPLWERSPRSSLPSRRHRSASLMGPPRGPRRGEVWGPGWRPTRGIRGPASSRFLRLQQPRAVARAPPPRWRWDPGTRLGPHLPRGVRVSRPPPASRQPISQRARATCASTSATFYAGQRHPRSPGTQFEPPPLQAQRHPRPQVTQFEPGRNSSAPVVHDPRSHTHAQQRPPALARAPPRPELSRLTA